MMIPPTGYKLFSPVEPGARSPHCNEAQLVDWEYSLQVAMKFIWSKVSRCNEIQLVDPEYSLQAQWSSACIINLHVEKTATFSPLLEKLKKRRAVIGAFTEVRPNVHHSIVCFFSFSTKGKIYESSMYKGIYSYSAFALLFASIGTVPELEGQQTLLLV